MKWKAKPVTSTLAICAVLGIISLPGCQSESATAPPASIGQESKLDFQASEKEVLRQPTILRAEVAAPPAAPLPGGGLGDDWSSGGPVPDARFSSLTLPGAAIPAADPHIADLLPLPSLDAPPLNQR